MGNWTLLARHDGADTSVSRCPEGHIHLEYGTTNIKLDEGRFLELAGVVCAAARKLGEPAQGCERPVGQTTTGPFGGN
jgi:hypothetical protein